MKFLFFVIAVAFSLSAFASVECEKVLVAHFKKLKIDTVTPQITQDYLNPSQKKMGACVYKTNSVSKMESLIKEAKKFEVLDSRGNEAIRVCTAISAFVSLGFDEKKIESEILSFQNGWSEGMRAPLKDLIKSEIASNQNGDDCASESSSTSDRNAPIEKSSVQTNSKEKRKDSSSTKQ